METLLTIYIIVLTTMILVSLAEQDIDFVVLGLIWPVLFGLILGRGAFVLLRDGGKRAIDIIFQVTKGEL